MRPIHLKKVIEMNHSHDHRNAVSEILSSPACDESKTIRRAVIIGCAVNIALAAIKLAFGYYGHSDALWADGFHSIGDVGSDVIMLAFVGLSFRVPGRRFPYGYGKFETLASLLISCLLIYFAISIFSNAVVSIVSFSKGEALPRPDIWTIVAVVLAMCVKECLFHFYHRVGKRTRSSAMISSAWHHRSDALASVATLVGVTFAHFGGEKMRVFDPCASLLIACFILIPAIILFFSACGEFMDGRLPSQIIYEAEEVIASVTGVRKLDMLRTRKSGPFYIFDVRIEVDKTLTVSDAAIIARQVENALKERFGRNILVSVITVTESSER